MKNNKKVLEVKNLRVSFRTNEGIVKAVRDVSYDLYEGETLAIVGESGSGKSVSSRTIMGILAPNAIIDGGSIIYQNQDLTKLREEEFHEIRGNKIGMIFQDPTSSLNPIMRVGKQIMEGILINGHHKKNRYHELFHAEKQKYENTCYQLKEAKTNFFFRKKKKNMLKRYKLENKQIKNNLSLSVSEREALIADNQLLIDELMNQKPVLSETDRKQLVHSLKEQIPKLRKELKKAKSDAREKVKAEYAAFFEEYSKEKEAVLIEKNEIEAKLNSKDTVLTEEQISKIKEDISKLNEKLHYLKEQYARKKRVTKKEAYEKAINIMNEVGIPEPEKRIKMYPFQFSGGMKQRIVIAIALTAAPSILICDEPTTALDVTIQAQILELLKKIKQERQLSLIFITHNLGVVANVADRVAVMYAGKIVEYGTTEDIFYDPKHPYTWALLSSMPDLNSTDKLITIPGTPPNMLYPPKGDAFAQRNLSALEIDFIEHPPMFKVSDTHYAATWLLDPRAPKVEVPDIILKRRETMKAELKKLKAKNKKAKPQLDGGTI